MSARTVLILGGGVGGVVAANRLRRLLPRGHRVLLIDREPSHLFQPSLLWLAVGMRRPERIQRPLARLARRGIDVAQAEVERIDPATRTVRAGGRDYAGDALIIALGAELAPDQIPCLAASPESSKRTRICRLLEGRSMASSARRISATLPGLARTMS